MALHLNLADHAADPPSSWRVIKAGRRWQLVNSKGSVLGIHMTKREAVEAKTGGFLVKLYEDEGRWFRGEAVRGWKPYQGAEAGGTDPSTGAT